MELVNIKNLSKSYGDKTILNNINLTITNGKIVGLLGKNGAGKTTLIKLINDLLTPTEGKILINGKSVGVETKKIISYLPERTYLNKQMKVTEVLDYFSDFYDNFDKGKALKLLKDLDLDVNMNLTKMSKGMQEKVQLVLVMSRSAYLYILDEPLGGVDPATRDYILDTILSNFKEIFILSIDLLFGFTGYIPNTFAINLKNLFLNNSSFASVLIGLLFIDIITVESKACT